MLRDFNIMLLVQIFSGTASKKHKRLFSHPEQPCLYSVTEIKFRFLIQRILNKLFCIKIFPVHIKGTYPEIVIRCAVINAFTEVITAGIICFFKSRFKSYAAFILINRVKRMEKCGNRRRFITVAYDIQFCKSCSYKA